MMNKRTDDRFRYAYKFRIYPNKEQEILINNPFFNKINLISALSRFIFSRQL